MNHLYLAATQAGNISTLAASSAKTALDATNQFWIKMYNGSGIFGELSKFCMGLAVVIELLGAIFAPTISFMMAKGSALAMAEGFQGAGSGAVMGVAKSSGKGTSDRLNKSGENKKAKASQATQATQHRQVLRALRIGRRG